MADTVPTETLTLTLNYEKIEWTYSKSDGAEDSFDFTAAPEKQEVGLLLPAVQVGPVEPEPTDSFDFTAAPEEQEVALLLPAVQAAREAARVTEDRDLTAADDGGTAYEYKLDGVMISSYDVNGSADADHDRWIDILSTDWGTDKPAAEVKEAGLRSDGELVQAVSEADMGGDFIL